MLKDGLSGNLIIRNGNEYKYPWIPAVMSVLPICDEFILLEAYSDLDNTYEDCLALAREHPKIRVIRGEWDGPEEEGHEYKRLARLTNQCIEESSYTWALVVQGDECVHEMGWPSIMRIVRGETQFGDMPRAVQFPFVHLVGNFSTRFRFVYQSAFRMCRADSSWRSDIDAWTMSCGNAREANDWIIANGAPYIHYGFALGLSIERMEKEKAFQGLFRGLNSAFPDPKVVEMADGEKPLSMAYLFSHAKETGEFTPFTGTHPAVMKDWIESHRQYEEVFE